MNNEKTLPQAWEKIESVQTQIIGFDEKIENKIKQRLITANTVDELKKLKLSTGDVVEMLGYYTAGDGAGHKRMIADSDDGSGVLLENGLYANIVHNGEVNVSWFGIKSDPVSSSTNTILFQKCLDSNCKKVIIDIPFFVAKKDGQDYCVQLTKNKDIIGTTTVNSQIKGYSDGIYDILQLNINDNYGYSDVRNFKIENVKFWFAKGGRHSVNQIGGLPMLECKIINNGFGSGKGTNEGYGFFTTDCKFAHSTFEGNECSSFYIQNCLDANKFINNNIYSDHKKGITLDITYGCYNNIIVNNTIVNRDGAIHIINGSQVKIQNNQIEQFPSYGLNQSNDNSSVYIECRNYKGVLNVIENNNFGGGTNVKHSLLLNNVKGTEVINNRFYKSSEEDIVINEEAWFTKIYPNNMIEGRTNKGFIFDISIKNLGYATKGCLLTDKITLNNSWKIDHIFVDPYTDEVHFNEGFFGGVPDPNVAIGKLSEELLPFNNFKKGTNNIYPFYLIREDVITTFFIFINTSSGEIKLGGQGYANSSVGKDVRFKVNNSSETIPIKTLFTTKYKNLI